MYSDGWLNAGCYKGDKYILPDNEQINYEFWYDNNGEKVGITLNFEYADDSHYELLYHDYLKLVDVLGGGTDFTKIFSDYFKHVGSLYEFSNFMKSNDIKYKEIHFY